ncbi:unnamed protein product [Macrosiphum euphorbiae]|uniref:MADF domain-containing protein n=1 Tax=Macrosiphum euphorbiae TaxID=13131 RepID=A0AAV0WI80_9HEMI|nr:unnamed protein product [Macrosiphum euphorbiae]
MCKTKWSNIRDQYRKVLNKKKTSSGQASKKNMKYKYEDQFSFLKPYFQERPTTTNIESHSSSEEDDDYEALENVRPHSISSNSEKQTVNDTAGNSIVHLSMQIEPQLCIQRGSSRIGVGGIRKKRPRNNLIDVDEVYFRK